MAGKKIQKLSDANLAIMKLVWQKGEVTINDVLEAVNAGRSDKVKRATVQVQMRRLERYGWLTHRVENREFYYAPLRSEAAAKVDILHGVRRSVFGGSYAELVKCLFAGSRVPEEELRRIAEFLRKGEKE
jgi:BlaI family transcriptional regulator, penicillinase repressor